MNIQHLLHNLPWLWRVWQAWQHLTGPRAESPQDLSRNPWLLHQLLLYLGSSNRRDSIWVHNKSPAHGPYNHGQESSLNGVCMRGGCAVPWRWLTPPCKVAQLQVLTALYGSMASKVPRKPPPKTACSKICNTPFHVQFAPKLKQHQQIETVLQEAYYIYNICMNIYIYTLHSMIYIYTYHTDLEYNMKGCSYFPSYLLYTCTCTWDTKLRIKELIYKHVTLFYMIIYFIQNYAKVQDTHGNTASTSNIVGTCFCTSLLVELLWVIRTWQAAALKDTTRVSTSSNKIYIIQL